MAIEKTINIKVNSNDAVKGVENIKDSIDDVSESTTNLSGVLDSTTGGAVSKFKGMKSVVSTVITSFKSLKVAIIGTGIGALLIAVVALGQAFTSSEEGQNKFAKIMGVIGSITGNLVDLLAKLGEKIIWAFENPKQAITDFANLVKDNIINRFEGILEYIPQMGKAIKQLFKGDFSGAATTATNAVAKVALGTDNLTESIKNASNELKKFGEEIAADAKAAADIADKRAKADKIERALVVSRAKADQQIADLRFKAEQRSKFTAAERVEFLKEASKISENITDREIYAARLRVEAKIAENELNKSNKDDLNEVAELEAKVINLTTTKLNLQKRLQTSITTFTNEQKAETKRLQDLETKGIEERQKAFETELEAEQKQYEERQKLLNEFLDEKEQAEMDAEDLRVQRAYEADQKKIQSAKAEADTKVGLAQTTTALVMAVSEEGSTAAKAAAAASALINTYQGITAELATKTATPWEFALKVANIATVAAIGFANVKKILSTNENGINGVGSAGSQNGGGTTAPSFNLIEGTASNQIADSVQGSNENIRAYVVTDDVTTGQDLDNDAINNASI